MKFYVFFFSFLLLACETAPGEDGTDGKDGAQGPQGVQGPSGAAGAAGAPGAPGEQGPTGPAGDSGSQGLEGPMGPQGLEGPMGPQGLVGPQGPQGPEGKSAVTWEDRDGQPVNIVGNARPMLHDNGVFYPVNALTGEFTGTKTALTRFYVGDKCEGTAFVELPKVSALNVVFHDSDVDVQYCVSEDVQIKTVDSVCSTESRGTCRAIPCRSFENLLEDTYLDQVVPLSTLLKDVQFPLSIRF